MYANGIVRDLNIAQTVIAGPECNTAIRICDRVARHHHIIDSDGCARQPECRVTIVDPVALSYTMRAVNLNTARGVVVRRILVDCVVHKLGMTPFRIEKTEVRI